MKKPPGGGVCHLRGKREESEKRAAEQMKLTDDELDIAFRRKGILW